jgi:uncharacterized protein (DUF2267 family)
VNKSHPNAKAGRFEMPYPHEYQVATDRFSDFLGDVKEEAGFGSRHMAYTMTQAVFQVFRRRVDLKSAIKFANVLPVGMRALFVDEWDTDEERLPFTDLETMNEEVKKLRPEHNFSTQSAIQQVAVAVKKQVDQEQFRTVLSEISEEALAFWQMN